MKPEKGALSRAFRRARDILRPGITLPVLLQKTHPLSGAHLILGKSPRKRASGSFIVGWQGALDNSMWYYKNFYTQREALCFFNKQFPLGPPVNAVFKDDSQVNKEYGWEAGFRLTTKKLTLPQMQEVTSSLSEIFNMAAPEIALKERKKKTYAEALLTENKINMYRENLAILLHEFSHLVNDQINKDQWAWHGPGFVRTYLAILSLFPEVGDVAYYEEQARNQGLLIADEDDVPACQMIKIWQNQPGGPPKTMESPI